MAAERQRMSQMSQASQMSRMSSIRKTKLDLEPERFVLVDQSFDGVSLISSSIRSLKSTGNFCRIRYGNNQELIVNLESQVVYLLNFIFDKISRLGFATSRPNIDLVDLNAELKHLRVEGAKHEYASAFLASRATYILVDVVQNADQTLLDFPQVTALLSDSELLTPRFEERLANINAPVAKPAKVTVEQEKEKEKEKGKKKPKQVGKSLSRKKSTGSMDSLRGSLA